MAQKYHINGLKMTKRFIQLVAVGATVALAASGIDGYMRRHKKVDTPFEDVVSTYSSSTVLDDYSVPFHEVLVTNDKEAPSINRNLNLIDASVLLERYLDISDILENVELDGREIDLNPQDTERALNMSIGEIEARKERYKKEKNTDDYVNLKFIKDYSNNWLRANGYHASFNLLMSSIKASFASELNVGEDYNESVTIIPGGINGHSISVKVNGQEKIYQVPVSFHEMCAAIDCLTNMQKQNYKGSNDSYREALNHAKVVTQTGVDIDSRDRAERER